MPSYLSYVFAPIKLLKERTHFDLWCSHWPYFSLDFKSIIFKNLMMKRRDGTIKWREYFRVRCLDWNKIQKFTICTPSVMLGWYSAGWNWRVGELYHVQFLWQSDLNFSCFFNCPVTELIIKNLKSHLLSSITNNCNNYLIKIPTISCYW